MNRRKRIQLQQRAAKKESSWRVWWRDFHPVGRFEIRFVGLSLLLVGMSAAPFSQSIIEPYTVASAHWAGTILHWFGLKPRVADNMLISSSFSITVLRECTAIELFAFLAAGILAFPATLYQKVAGVLLSALWVAALNLIRIVTVFIAGVYRPDLFNALHEDVWAMLLTGSMVVFAVVWVRWVSGTPKPAIPQG